MISNILNALVRFRAEATPAMFEQVFGTSGALRLWAKYHGICNRDLVSFYAYISPTNRLLFEAHLSAQLPPAFYDSPRCAECGGDLAESDIEAGDACGQAGGASANVCLDCAAALVLERDAEASGADADGPGNACGPGASIEYEPGSLLATVRVRLEEGGRPEP